jgi:hypothetical protein
MKLDIEACTMEASAALLPIWLGDFLGKGGTPWALHAARLDPGGASAVHRWASPARFSLGGLCHSLVKKSPRYCLQKEIIADLPAQRDSPVRWAQRSKGRGFALRTLALPP